MKDIKISITIETIIKIFSLAIIFWLIYTFSNLILIIVTSIILATAFEPLTNSLQKYKIPRVLSVSIVYLIITAFITSAIIFLIPVVTDQISTLTSNATTYAEKIDIYILEKIKDESSLIGKVSSEGNISSETLNIKEFFNLSNDSIKEILSSFSSGLSSFILIMVLSFYFAVQEHGMQNFLRIIIPTKYRKYSISLWARAQKKITSWMQGQFILGFIIGIMVYIGLLFLGVPQAGVLAIMAGFLELVPIIGQILAAIPAIFIAFTNGGVYLAVMVLSMYFIIQFIEGQIIYPLIVKKLVNVPSVVVILSLIVGAQLFGFLGVIIAIPLAAVLMEFLRDSEKFQTKEIKAGKLNEIDLRVNNKK